MKRLLLLCIPFTINAMEKLRIDHEVFQADCATDRLLTIVQYKSTTAEDIQELIDEGADVHALTDDGATALFWAAYAGNKAVCQMFLDKKLDVNAQVLEGSYVGCYALMAAANGNHIGTMKLLIEHGAQAHLCNRVGNNALMVAVGEGQKDACRLLLTTPNLRVGINTVNSKRYSALSLALLRKDKRLCELLIAYGADLNNQHGESPLKTAHSNRLQKAILFLVSKGALVNYGDAKGLTPLMLLAFAGNYELCEYLLSNGARVTMFDDGGYDALVHAASAGRDAIVELLIDSGAPMDRVYPRGRSLLHVACMKGHIPVVRILLARNANPDFKDLQGKIPLHYVAALGNTELCELLIQAKSKINWTDNNSNTPFTEAISHDHPEVCTLLSRAYKDQSIRYEGVPKLILAIKADSPQVCKLYLPFYKDIFGGLMYTHNDVGYNEVPFQLAVDRGYQDVCRVLIVSRLYMPGKEKPKALVRKAADLFFGSRDPGEIIFALLCVFKKYKVSRDMQCKIIEYSVELQDLLLKVLSSRITEKKSYLAAFVPVLAPAVVRFNLAKIEGPIQESLLSCENPELLSLLKSEHLLENFGEEMEGNARSYLYDRRRSDGP